MALTDNIEIIKQKLPLEERLCQLAEECSELTQAALKLRRSIDTKNPTPVTPADAWGKMVEEIADVLLCIKTIGVSDDKVTEVQCKKATRWLSRLKYNILSNGRIADED